jgi:hypothetical protein
LDAGTKAGNEFAFAGMRPKRCTKPKSTASTESRLNMTIAGKSEAIPRWTMREDRAERMIGEGRSKTHAQLD